MVAKRSHRLALCVGAMSGCIAAPAAAKPHLTPFVGSEVTVTDNLNLAPRDRAEAGAIVTGIAGFLLNDDNRHTRYALDARLNVDTTIGHGTDVGIRPDVIGTGRVELVEGHLYIDGRLLSGRELIDPRGRQGTTPAVGRGDRVTATTLEIAPYLKGHIGPWADTELRYTHHTTFVDARTPDGGPSATRDNSLDIGNSMTNTLTWRTTSGRELSRLRLTGLAEYSKTRSTPGTFDLERSTALLSAEYGVTRQVFLLASAGYERISSPALTAGHNGFLWTGGLRYRPGPRAELEFSYGHRYGGAVYDGHLTYALSSRWKATASYGESMESPQTRLGRPASRITFDPATGAFVLADTRDLGLQRSTALVGTLRAELTGQYSVDGFRLWATRETRRYDVGPSDTIVTGAAQWQHRLNDRLSLSAQTQYRRTSAGDTTARLHTVIGSVGLSYTVSRTATAAVTLSRAQRFASDPAARYTENSILFSLMARF